MTQTTALTNVYPQVSALYMAMELSQKDWKLAFAQGFEKPRMRTVRAGDLTGLEIELQTTLARFELGPETPVYSCFEAGRDGFWIHHELQRRGWNNIVVDPASIEVDRRARTRKTDRLDVQKLITRLVRWAGGEKGVWKVVAVPNAEQEDQRRLHRERKRLIKERTGHLARIRSLLATQGPAPEKLTESCLRHVSFNGAPMPKRLAAELAREWKRLELVNEQIREVEKAMRTEAKEDTEPMAKVRRVKSLLGIGLVFSRAVVTEFFAWRKFSNGREVGSLAGLAGTPFNSGKTDREQGISKAGNRWVRSLAIEIAWLWLRHQPDSAITKWYRERFDDGARRRKVGIVAVARRILVALWRFLEFDEVPAGAKLKAA